MNWASFALGFASGWLWSWLLAVGVLYARLWYVRRKLSRALGFDQPRREGPS